MPVTQDKVIYVDVSTNPDSGVEIADIQSVVPVTLSRTVNGVTERRSSSDLGVLCSAQVGDSVPDNAGGRAWTVSSRIDVNPWAKYKPVPFDQLDTTKHPDRVEPWLNADKTWNSSAQWWRYRKADTNEEMNYRCGFSIPTAEVSNLGSIRNGIGTWTRHRPRGQKTVSGVQVFEPFRKIDFNQYYHRAVCPYLITLPTEAHQPNFLDGKIALRTPTVDALNLSMSDLFAQGSNPNNPIYLGVAAIDARGNFRWRTQEEDGKAITFQGCDLATARLGTGETRTLRLVAFVCRKQQTAWTNTVETGKVFSLEAPGLGFSVIGDCVIKPAGQISYDITIAGMVSGQDANFMRDIFHVDKAGDVVSGETRYGQTSRDHLYHDYTLASLTLNIYENGSSTVSWSKTYSGSELTALNTRPTELSSEDRYTRFIFQTEEPVGYPIAENKRIPTPDPTKNYLREYVFNYSQ